MNHTLFQKAKHIFNSVGYVHKKAKPVITTKIVFFVIITQFLYLLKYVFLALLPGVNAAIVNAAVELTVAQNISYREIVIAISILLLYALYNFLSGSILAIMSKKVCGLLNKKVYGDFLTKTASIKYEYFNNPDLYENILLLKNDIYSLISNVYASGMFAAIIGLATVIIYTFIGLCKINVFIGILLLIANSTTIISSYIQTKKDFYTEVDQIKEKRWGNCYSDILTSAYTEKEVRLYSSFDYIYQKWLDSQKSRKKKTIELLAQYTWMDIIIAITKYLLLFCSIVMCIFYILKGTASIDSLMLIYVSHTVLDGKLTEFFGSLMNLNSLSFKVDRWKKFDSLENEHDAAHSNILDNSYDINISVENLTYQYENTDHNAVNNVSFTIKAREKVGIVGENGSGKTTLVLLLLGLLTPKSGSILINGKKIEDVKQDLRKNISAMFQDFCCYQLSIRDNILIGDIDNEKNSAEIEKIAALSKIDMFINKYDGIDTKIGSIWNNGVDFSGGQRQKICLSRLYSKNNSKFVVMDEPTSALDPEAETELYTKIIRDFSDKGMIMVSHRLGFMNQLDKIIVMKNGSIVDIGKHVDLMNRCDYYKEMYLSFEQLYKIRG